MTDLKQQTCSACTPLLTQAQIDGFMPQLPEWQLIVVEDIQQLRRCYKFNNYTGALAFVNQLAEIAELAGHHPAILLEWGKVTVTWWSHRLKGLHLNDFIMAAKTDGLLSL